MAPTETDPTASTSGGTARKNQFDQLRTGMQKNQLLASLRAHKGHKTRRRKPIAALIAVMNNNPTKRTMKKLLAAEEDWINKAHDIEKILVDLSNIDRDNEANYNDQLEELTEEITEMTRDVARACEPIDVEEVSVVGDSHTGMRVRTDLKPNTLSAEASPVEFTTWKEDFTTYFEASRLERGTAREQQQALLTFLDEELRRTITQNVERTRAVFQAQLLDEHGEEREDIDSCMAILDTHFESQSPINMRRLEFCKMQQKKGQTLTQYADSLRGMWMECAFEDFDPHEWLLTILANGCRNSRQKEKIREMKDRTWKDIKQAIKQWEADNNEDRNHDEQAKAVYGAKQKPQRKQITSKKEGFCYRCGDKNHAAPDCKISKDIICRKCSKKGHLAKACMSRNAKTDNKTFQNKKKALQVAEEEYNEPAGSEEEEECQAVSSGREILFS
jgi:hypothetical protein